MNLKHISIFNLIEIFRGKKQSVVFNSISAKAHCEQKHHHDFYCDVERPFVNVENI